MLKTALTWLTTLGLAFGLALASAAAFSAWNPEPKPKHYDDIKQSATATAKGIRLEVLGASFSGTETLVRMKASVADPEALRGEVGTDSVSLVVPAPQGFSGPFNEGESATRRIPSGELLVTLPSILSEAGYDGTVDLKFDELMVTVPSGPTRLSGQWSLRLTGPIFPACSEWRSSWSGASKCRGTRLSPTDGGQHPPHMWKLCSRQAY
jgi:hypothetical protein